MANQSNTDKPGTTSKAKVNQDLPDNEHDAERMKSETVTFDLPEVKDIPGQEHIHVPPMGELADTTISSDDEEGVGILDELEEEDTDIRMGTEADVKIEERMALERADEDMLTEDEVNLRHAGLDDQDNEGDFLNEKSLSTDVSGSDLDESGTEADDPMESIGEEDEENNHYSLGSDAKDNITEGTP